MKIVINKCYGGFGLSPEAIQKYFEKKGEPLYIIQSFRNGHRERPYVPSGYKNWWFSTKPLLPDGTFDTSGIVNARDFSRNDPILVEVVEELGERANDKFSNLKVTEIPDDVHSWFIDDYDGMEHVAEMHRTWG